MNHNQTSVQSPFSFHLNDSIDFEPPKVQGKTESLMAESEFDEDDKDEAVFKKPVIKNQSHSDTKIFHQNPSEEHKRAANGEKTMHQGKRRVSIKLVSRKQNSKRLFDSNLKDLDKKIQSNSSQKKVERSLSIPIELMNR